MTKHGSRQWEIWWPVTQVRNEWCNRYQDVSSGYSMLCHPCSKFIFLKVSSGYSMLCHPCSKFIFLKVSSGYSMLCHPCSKFIFLTVAHLIGLWLTCKYHFHTDILKRRILLVYFHQLWWSYHTWRECKKSNHYLS
jgi:hypothetical protein